MRVKRLEIQGFKSFKDKTVVHFDHGITGIVGPNGCGKSNIVDAFFWVMGEQSYKHMRGSGSDDLIFNGSSKYSPLGLAEATLVMETDAPDTENAPAGASVADIPVHLRAKEVSVTRRLYRSGEGEYFINGVPARLKDIQELFMDTGVGAKGYSVIEQGQIGKIVNAKPEDRRLLIEEAAGIAKYKARKKESLRKMEATQGNLSRLSDVIQEIERSLGSLERQAQKARQYRKYKDELLDKELNWGRRKIQVIRQKLESLKANRDALEQELVGLRAELQTTENNLEQDRVVQLTDTKTAEDLQSNVQRLSNDLTREQSALELSRRRRGDLASQLDALERERSEVQASIATETERLAERESLVADAQESHVVAAERAREVEAQASKLRAEADEVRRAVDTAKRELMEKITRASDLTSKNASIMSQIEAGQLQLARLTQAAEAQAARVQEVQQEEAQARTQAESLRIARDEKVTARKVQSELVRTLERQREEASRAREESLRGLAKVKSKLQSLEELDSAHEGLGDGSRAALEWAQGKGEILGLATAFDVASEHDLVIAGWLESRLEGLATTDAALAVRAIEHVQAEGQGRVAIHIPSTEPSTRVDFASVSKRLAPAGFAIVGELSSLVKINTSLKGELRTVAERVIAGVVVVESLAPLGTAPAGVVDALAHDGWSLVALDGSIYSSAGGFVAGGKIEGDGGVALLRRKRQIADLGTEVAQAEEAYRQAEEAMQAATTELEAARASAQTLQGDLQAIEIQLAAIERDLHQMARALREAETQLESTREEIEDLRARAESGRAEREEIEARVSQLAAERTELESRAQAGDAELATRDAAAHAKGAEMQAARIEEASLRERAVGLKRELELGRTVVADRERRLAEIGRTLERASTEQAEFDGGEGDLVVRIEELTKTLAIAREELARAKDRLEQSGAKISGALDRIKELHKSGDAKAAETNQLALELEKLASEDAHLVQNLEEKYGPGCLERPVTSPIQEEMTEPVVTAEMTAEEELALSDEVERLRERIRRLGDVNPSAVEEFEEVKKRHDYLHKERADLEQSILNLQEAIEHINKTSEERFKRAFEAIADRFERLFPIVFGGGQAQLSLIYPEGSQEILDAGVDILAQPPGKKIQNMGLLSGGEKALTAVSLIFAIFMVKPSPFCVLDEVDAPLDDANIGKFNALLREMAAKSQFIVITHNKKTMELNDTLYGVTMEEPGVSKMVSIELR